MRSHNHAEIGAAANIPATSPGQVLSVSPVILPSPDRDVNLELRVTIPSTGDGPLPIVLLSHGHGPSHHLSSLEGYAPLAEFLASQGFAVLQPTHLSSRSLGIAMTGDNIRHLFLESRAADMTQILNRLDEIEASLPVLGRGRLDRSKVAVVGHSLGGLTASLLLGATNADPRDGVTTNLVDERITAGVLLGAPGTGGEALSKTGAERLPFHNVDFSDMRTPALVVWGENDGSEMLTTRGAEWHEEPYALSPGPKVSFMVKGAKHGFGGISGWDAAECADESPERLAAVSRMVAAYLKTRLVDGDDTWDRACAALAENEALGRVESK
ncbi:hypothetical protein DL546_007347 [Coniochaeta pulveracea]|uniref:AB hydrolase-1 domain-containing protein n=1 Tax=Coniochaeta pulveracea TaxID=177199 RepID=A0A420Y8E9_9PEZI|nr:hypothetical protein DL546_007347 [Coniochaeta pulveracea]